MNIHRIVRVLGILFATVQIFIQPVSSAVVSVCDDASLRAALAGGGTVTFGCGGTIQLTNSLVIAQNTTLDGSGHTVVLSGGGLVRPFVVNSGVQFSLKAVTVANGFGSPHAGALLNSGSTLLIDCTFSNNLSLGSISFGGAIFHGSGSLGIAGCTFVGNRALGTNSSSGLGGAIGGGYFAQSGPVGITNCTFFGNSATGGGAILITCNGGANGPVNILNSTFVSNTNGALSYCNGFGPNRMVIKNSVLAYNNGPNCTGVVDGGHNISSDTSGEFTHPFSLENIDPLLGPLANNGGPTLTLALLATSPAIDAGGPMDCTDVDQRGQPRPVGLYCDIGAFEANPATAHPGVLQFAVVTNSVTESNRSLTITVVRAGGTEGDVSVSFASSNRTATAGSDFQATNGTLAFLSGERTNTFQLLLFDDSAVEGIESLDLILYNPTGGAGLGRAISTVNIQDDDISIAFASASYPVSEGIGTATLTLLRTGNTSSSASVTLTPVNVTASANDYQIGSSTVTFASGQTSATIPVTIVSDTRVEANEVFNIALSNPTAGAVLANPSTAAITILDNDGVQIVNNCDEASLRFALDVGGKIRLACDGTIVLTNAIGINRNASLDASGRSVAISGNDAVTIFNVGTGVEFSMTNLTITRGFSSTLGGGIHNSGILNAVNCTFSSNSVVSPTNPNGAGGAIQNRGTLRVMNSSFLGNRASYTGGAIAVGFSIGPLPGPAYLTNCTFVGNVSSNGTAIAGGSQTNSYVVSCTLAGNTGAAISGTYQLLNSILASTAGLNCAGVIIDGGHNISSDNSCGFTQPSSFNTTNPKLGELGSHGGPTLTVSLLEGSPAIDAASSVSSPLTDQRGIARPYGIGFDVGAFETTLIGSNPGVFRLTTATQTVSELQSGLIVQVERTGGAFGTATVNFATSDISTTAGVDYAVTNGTLVFAPGEIQKSFTIRLLNDTAQESDEMFSATLSAPTGGATLGSPQASVVTIVDDETATVVTVCDDASLRAAVAGRGVVVFGCDGVIQLTNTLTINQDVVIDGAGHQVVLSGSNTVRLFQVYPGVRLKLQSLTLADGIALGTNGNAGQPGGLGAGGAIYNNGGKLLVESCQFLRNQAKGGNGGPTPGGISGAGDGGPARGGAIFNTAAGLFTISNSVFLLNQASGGDGGGLATTSTSGGEAAGAGIFLADGRGEIIASSCVSNAAVSGRNNRFGGMDKLLGRGGAICNEAGALIVSHVEMTYNSVAVGYLSAASGGAIHQEDGSLETKSSYLHKNRVDGGSGAGIGTPFGFAGRQALGGAISIKGGRAEITDSTLAQNRSIGGKTASLAGTGQGYGGAIFNAGLVTLTNSTVAENEAFAKDAPTPSYGGNSYGGGLCNQGGSAILNHVTIAGNRALAHAAQLGGGIYSTNGNVEISNAIIANSASGSNCIGTIIDGGYNLSSDGSANFTAPGSLNNTDPVLGPLADYGGPTPTMALLNGSPAIDAAGAGSCPTADQRGIARPSGAACDIGAFESAPPYTILGRVTGFTPGTAMSVSAGSSTVSIPTNGNFALHGLNAGSYVVTPASPEAVFVLSNRPLNLIRDTIGVDFHSYRSNALVIERVDTGITRSTYAGEAGQNFHVELSTATGTWTPYSTNVTASSGLFQFNDTNAAMASPRLFRVVKP